jgi:hypothetical protein
MYVSLYISPCSDVELVGAVVVGSGVSIDKGVVVVRLTLAHPLNVSTVDPAEKIISRSMGFSDSMSCWSICAVTGWSSRVSSGDFGGAATGLDFVFEEISAGNQVIPMRITTTVARTRAKGISTYPG